MVKIFSYDPKRKCETNSQLRYTFSKLHTNKIDITIKNIDLTNLDFEKLKPGRWLNNKLISSYLWLVREYYLKRDKIEMEIVSTYFFDYLIKKDYKTASKYLENVIGKKEGIVVIPICFAKHWWVCFLDLGSKAIYFYDSNYRKSGELGDIIREEFKRDISILFKKEFRMIDKSKSMVQQKNNDDCGVFICFYTRYFTSLVRKRKYVDTKLLRMKMAQELYCGKIMYDYEDCKLLD